MRHKFFHIPVLYAEQAENALNQFCSQHRIAHVEKHFVDQAENSYWAICVTWLQGDGAMPKAANSFSRKPKVDSRQLQAVYASVEAITANADSRAWRQRNLRMHPALTV